jgi:hypothetical protein
MIGLSRFPLQVRQGPGLSFRGYQVGLYGVLLPEPPMAANQLIVLLV